jgi:hypothetical protein
MDMNGGLEPLNQPAKCADPLMRQIAPIVDALGGRVCNKDIQVTIPKDAVQKHLRN